jgi:protein SCO1/2
MTRNLLVVFTVLLVGLTALSLWLNQGPTPEQQLARQLSELQPAAAAPAAIGGSFALTDQNGKTVKDTDFRGKIMLVFFGFTHCPDICPVTLSTLGNVLVQLGDEAKQVIPVLITVDPARDTPRRLKEYLKDFNPQTVGLTGTKEELEKVLKDYKAYAARQEAAKKDHEAHGEGHEHNYVMNHSSLVYLMGKNGEYVTHFSQDEPEQKMVETLRKQLQ